MNGWNKITAGLLLSEAGKHCCMQHVHDWDRLKTFNFDPLPHAFYQYISHHYNITYLNPFCSPSVAFSLKCASLGDNRRGMLVCMLHNATGCIMASVLLLHLHYLTPRGFVLAHWLTCFEPFRFQRAAIKLCVWVVRNFHHVLPAKRHYNHW